MLKMRFNLIAFLVLPVFLFLLGCDGPHDDISPGEQSIEAKGHLVLIGGGHRPDDVMRHLVSLSRDGSFIVIPHASSIPDTVGWEQRDELIAAGAANVEILHFAMGDTSDPGLARKIREASGIWFSGGDQNRLRRYFSDSMINALHDAYRNGAVIGGTSAGTAIQSRTMITGDEEFPLSDRFNTFSQITHGNVIVDDGFGLVENMIIDQHFIRRNRLNRLINALIDSNYDVAAAGIDEATALWIGPDGLVTVIGESQVVLIEKSGDAEVSDGILPGATNLRLHVLPPGSTFVWKNSRIREISLPKATVN